MEEGEDMYYQTRTQTIASVSVCVCVYAMFELSPSLGSFVLSLSGSGISSG